MRFAVAGTRPAGLVLALAAPLLSSLSASVRTGPVRVMGHPPKLKLRRKAPAAVLRAVGASSRHRAFAQRLAGRQRHLHRGQACPPASQRFDPVKQCSYQRTRIDP